MAKRRVYELAKDYGMKGPAFVTVLKDLGFEKVKTHMAVLDDADQMMIEVRLETVGYNKQVETETARTGSATQKKAGITKKAATVRKKKLGATETEEGEDVRSKDEGTSRLPSAFKKKEVKTQAPKDKEVAVVARAAEAQAPSEDPVLERAEPDVATASDRPVLEEPPAADETLAAATDTVAMADEKIDASAVTASPVAGELSSGELSPGEGEPLQDSAVQDGAVQDGAIQAGAVQDRAIQAGEEEGAGIASLGDGALAARDDAADTAPAIKLVKRPPAPERKAKILGKIDLPSSVVDDAKSRSAGGPRNPASVDRNLRRAAMEQFRSRGAQTSTGARRGPTGYGPGRMGPGGRGGRGGGSSRVARSRDPLAPPPGIDPAKVVQVEAPVSVKKLSEALGHRVNQILVVLLRLGVPANINSFLDKDQVELVALELSRNVEVIEEREVEEELISSIAKSQQRKVDEDLHTRSPIVTLLGHVDHGKTTLLDKLRSSELTKGEAGGITQHIGAYRVQRGEHDIVFLDTPGHAAFTAMRARGAELTDIVILIVAANDGVMPQTEEALAHAKAADVPIIVAINKCDLPDANPRSIRQQLALKGLQPEEWGGNTQFVEISAKDGTGLDELIEKIDLEAMVLELKADPDLMATGAVIEAKQTPEKGNEISVMVMDGTLRKGDLVLCGAGTGRIRLLVDDRGEQLDSAPPGTPVEILGLPELPSPGDKFYVVKDNKMAKQVADQRGAKKRTMNLAEKSKTRLMDLQSQLAAKKVEELRLIVKADVMGSLEPIRSELEKLSNPEVRVRILHYALGGVSVNDVALADASNALIVGFNSVPDEKARLKAEATGVTIRRYNVIYELIDDAKKALEGLLSPERKEEVRGHAEVRKVFKSSKFGNIAGCLCTDGSIHRKHKARVTRDGVVLKETNIMSLRREKDETREVKQNFECGIRLQGFDDFKPGDIIETYEILEIKRTLGDVEIKKTIADEEEVGA